MTKRILPTALVAIVFLAACNSNKTTDTTSPYAEVTAFTFRTDTLNPGLSSATYKIEQRTDTGYIYNKDSLTYGTSLRKTVPVITYKAVPASATFVLLGDSTVPYSGSDTIDFTQDPVYLHVRSSDLQNEKWYRFAFTVHQQDPDSFAWNQLTPQIFPPQLCEEKAFWLDDAFRLFVNNGFSTRLFRSINGAQWEELSAPVGLPAVCRVRDILQHNDTLYYAEQDTLYCSVDALHWTAYDCSAQPYTLVNMLVSYDGRAWCVLQERATQQIVLGYVVDSTIVADVQVQGLQGNVLPADFPVSDFAALSFAGSSERPRAMIIGGRTLAGTPLNTRWNLEMEPSAGYRIKNFSIEQPQFRTLTGMSVIQYNGQLMMFGGLDDDLEWRSNILYSVDEGMHWLPVDTAHNRLPDAYGKRQKQTLVLHDNNIYLIGGQTFVETYSDVYRGRLNSIDW